MAVKPLSDAPQVPIASLMDLRLWLAAHHDRPGGVWIVSWKKADPDRHVPYSDIVDEALCWGWVDSLPRAKDEERTMLYLSPRKAGSNWSRVNKNKVVRLTAEGRMMPPGIAAVARAQSDGSWSALDDVENLIVPQDLLQALTGVPDGMAIWEGWPRTVRRGALEQLVNARRPATRAARIQTIVQAAQGGERPFQWRKTGPLGD